MAKNFEINKEMIRNCIFYDFRSGLSGAESCRRLCAAFGEGIVCHQTVLNWFARFASGNYDTEDQPRSGRPPEIDDNALLQLVESNTRLTTTELAVAMGCGQTTISRHLKSLGKVRKLGSWIPHKLTEQNRDQRVTIASFLLSFSRTTSWLDSILTSDEKWVLYENTKRKYQWIDEDAEPEPEPKADLHPKKVMISVWWNVRGVVHWELLPPNTTVTARYYCAQLQRVKAALNSQRLGAGKVRYLHDNARPHTAKETRRKLNALGWEVLPHPPYSPDLAPTDYHLFRHLNNSLAGKIFKDETTLETHLQDFFDSQPPEFYKKGIHKLKERWQEVVDSDGEYII